MTIENNKISIALNEANFIVAVAHGGSLEGGIKVDDFDFTEDIQAYQYVDGKITLNEERLKQLKNELSAHEELQALQEVLSETDAVALQWWEENELGLEHGMPEEEFQAIMEKRQCTRLRIRQLNKIVKC